MRARVVLASLATVLLVGCTSSSHSSSASHSAQSGAATAVPGVDRRYYIAADEVPWNYAPQGHNVITGKPFDEVADVFVKSGPDRIGSTYSKCLYRGYTDQTFTKRAVRPAADAYLGLLGPVIRAQVGDMIHVVFRNNCSFRASVHAHGVFYDKNSEGAPYDDGSGDADREDDAVAPGHTYTYAWKVPERAGRGPMDGSSVMWMYHSHTDEVRDTHSGLMGPMVVTAAGKARPDGSPKDVDRELFSLFNVMNENQSHYLKHEAEDLAQPPRDPRR